MARVVEIQEKTMKPPPSQFYLFKVIRSHVLPLTNVTFNKSGSQFITGSYDRTCKVCFHLAEHNSECGLKENISFLQVWDTASGEELLTLEGHQNVVYAIAFNLPFRYMRGE